MQRFLIMAALPLLLWVLPIKANAQTHLVLAFSLWGLGGLFLVVRGLLWLEPPGAVSGGPELDLLGFVLPLILATAIGFAKGRFVLSKSSARNIERILAFDGPQKLIHVYSLRSWILIGVMMSLAMALSFFSIDLGLRALINIGVGMALVASSRAYLVALQAQRATTA